jgi:hypothetical protein
MVERLFRKEETEGSIPFTGSEPNAVGTTSCEDRVSALFVGSPCLHRLVAKDTRFSSGELGFNSPWRCYGPSNVVRKMRTHSDAVADAVREGPLIVPFV